MTERFQHEGNVSGADFWWGGDLMHLVALWIYSEFLGEEKDEIHSNLQIRFKLAVNGIWNIWTGVLDIFGDVG